jgi:hypothetical protein
MQSSLKKHYNAGISIAELAIVITVIALLVAVVTGGRSIKKASETRGVISNIQQYQTAIENFKSEYNGLPGDLNNATSYFSATINGDGNGQISYPVNASSEIESLRAWQQLSLANFMEGSFSGVATVAGQADIGINVPSSKRNKVGYFLITDNLLGGSAQLEIRVGAFVPSRRNDGAAFLAAEAKSLDTKIDDGFASSGKVLATKGYNLTQGCVLQLQQEYDVADENISCILAFLAQP